MSFSLEKYSNLRPYAYHLTSRENIPHIIKSTKLFSSTNLLVSADRTDLKNVKRKQSEVISIGGIPVVIRDQSPLHEGNMSLPKGYAFPQFVEYLNNHIFFWPGSVESPIPYGQRHFERYVMEEPTIIRIQTEHLLRLNPEPLFSNCNSGSPRCSKGKGVPRGPNTFESCEDADYSPGQVKELVFREQVNLGSRWEYRTLGETNWKNFPENQK